MDLYVWVLQKKGFNVDETGFFLYCDGNRFTDRSFLNDKNAIMEFKITLIEYKTDLSWIELTLNKIHSCLRSVERPKHSDNCEYGIFIGQI